MDIAKDLGLPEFVKLQSIPIEPNYYGAAQLICDRLGVGKAPPSNTVWAHGWEWHDLLEVGQGGYEDLKHRRHLTTTKAMEAFLVGHGFTHVNAVGMPFSYTERTPGAERIPGSLLVMPPHTLMDAKMVFDEAGYVAYIKSISGHFSRVVFCISVACFANGLWIENLDKHGFDYVVGAGMMDQNALLRMRKLFDTFEYMTSNNIGSHILYASFCGVKVSLAGEFFNPPVDMYKSQLQWMDEKEKKVRILRVEMSQESFIRKKFPRFFSEPQDAVTHVEWAKEEIGFYNHGPLEDLYRLLFERVPEDVKQYFDTVFRLDANDDAAAFFEFVQSKVFYDVALMMDATSQLLAKARMRSAYTLAEILHSRKQQDPVISLALQIGHLFRSQTTENMPIGWDVLETQVDALSAERQEQFRRTFVTPLITQILTLFLGRSDDARVQMALGILKASDPRYRAGVGQPLKVIDGIVSDTLF